MNDIKFNSLEDLYNRLKPALRSKIKELHKLDKIYIKENDIFDFLTDNKWENSNNLTLDQMVDDILYVDNDLIDEYVQKKIIRENYNNLKERD